MKTIKQDLNVFYLYQVLESLLMLSFENHPDIERSLSQLHEVVSSEINDCYSSDILEQYVVTVLE